MAGFKSNPAPAPELNGVAAVLLPEDERIFYEYVYHDVGMRLPFTGGMLLAQDFISDLYVHMGFHPAWKYETVHELTFDKGCLVSEADVSEKLAEVRRAALSRAADPDSDTDRKDMMEWIARCFSRDYRL